MRRRARPVVTRRGFLGFFLTVSIVVALFFYVSFFCGVMSGVAEWTGSGFVWTIQVFHNFLHGRPFQSSLYAVPAATGSSVGFVRKAPSINKLYNTCTG